MFAFRHVYLHNTYTFESRDINLSSQISVIVCLPKPGMNATELLERKGKKKNIARKKSKKIKTKIRYL